MKIARTAARAIRALRAVAISPPFVGALVVVGLAAWAGQRGAGDDAELGDLRRADAVETFVEHRFASEITRMKIGIVATAIALGLVIGLVAEVLTRLRYTSPRLTRRNPARVFVENAFVCLGVHATLVLWGMADSPQLYASRWYAKGGVARTIQVFATDLLGPRGVVLFALALAVLYVRPTRLVYVAHRAAGLVRRPFRHLALRAARKLAAPSVALLVAGIALRSFDTSTISSAVAAPPSAAPHKPPPAPPPKPAAAASAAPAAGGAAKKAGAAPATSAGKALAAGPHPPPSAKPKPHAVAPTPPSSSAPAAPLVTVGPTPLATAEPTTGTGTTTHSGTGMGTPSPTPTAASAGPAPGVPPAPALSHVPVPVPVPVPGSPSPGSRRPNVLILAADSLRHDRLTPRVAPNLSRLAARGTTFDRAYVSIPRTFPSWVTILTGRHSHHHGIRSMFPTWDDRARDFDAMPQRFARAGYATGVVSDYAGDIFGRIDLGFSRVDAPTFDFRQMIRQRVLERETPLLPFLHSQLGRRLFPVMRELNDAADPMLLAEDVAGALHALNGQDKPFFLTVFFSTAHFPYAAPAPYYAKYTDPAYRGRFKYHKPVGLGSEDAPPDAADIRQIHALYDGSVSAVDDAVGRVLRSLEREGALDNTIIVITADHGEMLFDHGHGQGHGDHLFGDEVVHVPFVVFDPRIMRTDTPAMTDTDPRPPGRHTDAIARDVDLAPTLYQLAGVAPPADLDGRSLAPALRGGAIEPRFAYAETELWFTEEIPGLPAELRMPYPGIVALTELDTRHNAEIVMRREMVPMTRMARHRMIRDGRWKLVYVPTRRGVKYMLFDTVADPDETHDVAAAKPDEVARLKTELWAWMLRDPTMEQKDGYLMPRPIAPVP